MSGNRTAASRVANGLLTLAAIGGAVCIVFVVLAVFFHVSLIMFKTGSMSPTIPTGSLAIVREIPAGQVTVGEVVTVDRADALPITHRVTSVTPAAAGFSSITLRGDANPVDDPAPYLVSSVRLVLFSVPQLAYAVAWASNPLVLGGITLGATAVVTWAFWPREEGSRSRRGRSAAHGASGMRHAKAAGVITFLVIAGAATLAPVQPAQAAVTEETIVGQAITLVSIGDKDAMDDLQPGTPVLWQVGVSAHPAQPGTVDLHLEGSGGLLADPRGLWITVDSCSVRWSGSACAGSQRSIVASTPGSTGLAGPLSLGSMRTDDQLWLLIAAQVPNSATMLAGSARLALMASGVGDPVIASSDAGAVAYTGVDVTVPLRSAIGAIIAGLVLAFAARFRRTHEPA